MSHACQRFWTATKSSQFAHFWQGTEFLAPTQNHILTSKSGPRPSVFNRFDFEMCFAPQRRALFEDLNFQKCSEAGVFCTSWLGIVLRATTACTFWTSQLPKALRSWCALYILTWTCASRHNGVQLPKVLRSWCALYILAWKCALRHNSVQFFISHLATWLCTRRFKEPTFGPSGATNHWKNTVFRDFFYLVATYIFLLTRSLLWSSLFFSSLTLPTSAFSSVHIVGSLTSKLPSIILTIFIYIIGLMEQWVWNSIHSLNCNWIAITILEPYKSIHLQISATKWGGLGLQYRLPARIFLHKQEGLCPPFCIWNHFVVDSFQIIIFIL